MYWLVKASSSLLHESLLTLIYSSKLCSSYKNGGIHLFQIKFIIKSIIHWIFCAYIYFKYLEINEKKKKLERNIVIYICINTTFDDVYPSSILSK